jgi:RecB family exonuclease
LEYILKLKIKENYAANLGTFIHTIFEGMAKGELNAQNWIAFAQKSVHTLYDIASTKYPELSAEQIKLQVWKDIETIVNLVLNRAPQFNPLNRKIIGIEKKFLIDIGKGIKIKGYIDLLLEIDAETVEVHDWKTGSWKLSYREAQKDPQVRIYDLATRIMLPQYKYILVTLDYVQHRPITVALTDKHADGTRRALERYWRSIHNMDTPTRIDTPNWICEKFCDRAQCNIYWEQLQNGAQLVNE